MNIFKVIDGNLIHAKKETVNTGSKRFFKVQFDFNETWEQYKDLRFVEFYQNIDGLHYKVSIDSLNSVIANIPTKVLKTDLPIYVAVIAENYDASVVANTNFLPISIKYGAGTNESKLVENEEDELYQLYAPDTSVRYLRLRNRVLEYSSDKENWYKVSSAVTGGGVSEERLEEVVNETLEQAKQYTDNEIATFDFVKIVDTLPEVGLPNREYFVRKESADTSDLFDEWAWINKGTEEEPNYGWEFKGTKQFEVDLTDYVKFTDIASATKAGVVKVESWTPVTLDKNGFIIVQPTTKANIDERNRNRLLRVIDLDYAWKVGATTNTEEWTDEEKALARALLGAIGDTDYATNEKAGVVKVIPSKGISLDNGALKIENASENLIIKKTATAYPLTPAFIDLIMKVGLTTNTETLTEEERTKALEWLGAVQYMESTRSAGQPHLYAQSKDGTFLFTASTSEAGGSTIPIRLPSGQVRVGNATHEADAMPKGQVEALIAGLQAQIDELKG